MFFRLIVFSKTRGKVFFYNCCCYNVYITSKNRLSFFTFFSRNFFYGFSARFPYYVYKIDFIDIYYYTPRSFLIDFPLFLNNHNYYYYYYHRGVIFSQYGCSVLKKPTLPECGLANKTTYPSALYHLKYAHLTHDALPALVQLFHSLKLNRSSIVSFSGLTSGPHYNVTTLIPQRLPSMDSS